MRLLLVLALLVPGILCAQPDAERPPNVVFVFADDLGYGDLSSYGSETIRTPHLDKLAADGIRFTDFYSVGAICSPSRAGLMTGRYPIRMGIRGVFFPESWTGLPPEEVTLAEALGEQGYASGVFGKWHLGHHIQFLPLQQGFDEYFGIPYSNDMEAVAYLEGNDVYTEDVDQRYTVQEYTDRAIDFMERHRDQPFFVYVPHSMPHVPLYASPEFEGRSPHGLYADVIEEMDASVGRLVDALDRLDLAEETIIVFTSDNGPWLEMIDHGGSAGPLRQGKGTTFEGGMRVPTVLRWTGTVAPGQVEEGVASMVDWFPTFVNLAGGDLADVLPAGRPIDGHDLTPVLLGTGTRADQDMAFFHHGRLQAFRSGDWKIKKPNTDTGRRRGRYSYGGEPEHGWLLFNLRDDIGETTNLYEEYPEQAARLKAEMEALEARIGPYPPAIKMRERADKSHEDYLRERYGSGQ